MTRFEHLNNLRILNGQKPLKAWKESKAKLEAAIKKLEAQTRHDIEEAMEDAASDNIDQLIEEDKKVPCRAPSVIEHELKSRPHPTPDKVTLVEIAKELSINPKIARAKIRRGGDHCPGSLEEDKYVYAIGDKQKVIDFLTSDFRKR